MKPGSTTSTSWKSAKPNVSRGNRGTTPPSTISWLPDDTDDRQWKPLPLGTIQAGMTVTIRSPLFGLVPLEVWGVDKVANTVKGWHELVAAEVKVPAAWCGEMR